MLVKSVLFAALILGAIQMTYACEYNGQRYPDGTRIGPYLCAGGQWVPG